MVVNIVSLCYISWESRCERRNINEFVESLCLGENKYEVNIKITFKLRFMDKINTVRRVIVIEISNILIN